MSLLLSRPRQKPSSPVATVPTNSSLSTFATARLLRASLGCSLVKFRKVATGACEEERKRCQRAAPKSAVRVRGLSPPDDLAAS